MAKELVTMSRREIDRLGVIRKVCEGRLSQEKAGELIGLSARQVRRLIAAYELSGPAGLASRKRGMQATAGYRMKFSSERRILSASATAILDPR